MSNIINFGGSSSGGSSDITAPIIGKDFTWTGGDGTYQVFQDVETNWRVKFLNSGTFTPLKDMVIDAFLVGGGGGGSGGGAGGGYTNTTKSIVLTANTPYIIEIGAGGPAPEGDNPLTPGKAGGNTSAFSVTANGGAGGNYDCGGGNGGSGGGSYDIDNKKGYDGGSDGSNGGGPNGGTGQGTTTREFGESTGDLYASGGSTVPGRAADGADNTGDGGGDGKAGGSGIVIIRKHKEAAA